LKLPFGERRRQEMMMDPVWGVVVPVYPGVVVGASFDTMVIS
jgi:hypothetical protein